MRTWDCERWWYLRVPTYHHVIRTKQASLQSSVDLRDALKCNVHALDWQRGFGVAAGKWRARCKPKDAHDTFVMAQSRQCTVLFKSVRTCTNQASPIFSVLAPFARQIFPIRTSPAPTLEPPSHTLWQRDGFLAPLRPHTGRSGDAVKRSVPLTAPALLKPLCSLLITAVPDLLHLRSHVPQSLVAASCSGVKGLLRTPTSR